jgi:hypothetical protein
LILDGCAAISGREPLIIKDAENSDAFKFDDGAA